MAYGTQLRALLLKNFLLARRSFGGLAVQLAAPLVINVLLYLSDRTSESNGGFFRDGLDTPVPAVERLGALPRCMSIAYPDTCVSIGYTPDSVAVSGWVAAAATAAGIPPAEVRGFPTEAVLNTFLVDHPNRTVAAYVFEERDLTAISTGNVSYVVQFNVTRHDEFPLGNSDFVSRVFVPTMVRHMNEVLMANVSGRPVDLDVSLAVMPHPPLEGINDAYQDYGLLLTFAVYMCNMVLFLSKLVNEKVAKLRQALRLAGQRQSQHFVSWGLVFFLTNTITSALLIGFGLAFGFAFFRETAAAVYILTFFLFGVALVPWVFLFDTVTRSVEAVSLYLFNFFIVNYFIASGAFVLYLVESDGSNFVSDSVTFLRYIFALLPPVMFYKCLFDISQFAIRRQGMTLKLASEYTSVFPVTTCWAWMIWTSAVVMVLAIYLDNVLSSPTGTSQPWSYFLRPSYWRSPSSSVVPPPPPPPTEEEAQLAPDSPLAGDGATPAAGETTSYDAAAEDPDVRREREAVDAGARDDRAVVLRHMRKTFKKLVAVDDVSVSIPHHSLFCLLGHNGAGKSTLFNMMTGLTDITAGDATVYGHSVRDDMAALRPLLGVCPQHDILFDRLTGAEHVRLFAALKGVPRSEREDEVARRLEQVSLTDVGGRAAGLYSGGMRRRLSVALALVADPKIVFLDEPTTGMDPIARRGVWDAIQSAKADRVIILVTHSMEEAEKLADGVAIMSRGKLRVLGTPLRLKAHFGAGYRLSVLCTDTEAAASVSALATSILPSTVATPAEADAERTSGVMMELLVPRAAGRRMSELVAALEARKVGQAASGGGGSGGGDGVDGSEGVDGGGSAGGVLSFGVSQSTLEEVFIAIADLSAEPEPELESKGCCGKVFGRCGCFGCCGGSG